MVAERNIVHGVVRNGVIIPDKGIFLPKGVSVEIRLSREEEIPAELRAEFAAWDKARADAYAPIDEWESDAATRRKFAT